MSKFELAIPVTLANEGDAYITEDHGRGPSKYGVTLESFREFHSAATAIDIAMLTPTTAAEFYRTAFWDRYRFGDIDDQALAGKVFDIGVNAGPETSVRFLQLAVGAMPADGVLGPKTIAVVNASDPVQALAAFRMVAAQYYRQLVMRDPSRANELAGWLARVAK